MHSEMVEAEGQNVQRYVYGTDGARISAEFTYAKSTERGNGGENILSDMAVLDNKKIYYRRSLLDSTLFAVDESGDVFRHMIYDAWGNPGLETKLDANYMGVQNLNNFTGYTWDETLGLYFAQNRFYDSVSHRFTQEDPVKDGTNWFAYCGNNPLTNVDVWGLFHKGQRLRKGSTGEDVRLLQIRLNEKNKYDNKAKGKCNAGIPDGVFGSGTEKAVNGYKDARIPNGNKGDDRGVVGATTWSYLGLPIEGGNNTTSYVFYDPNLFDKKNNYYTGYKYALKVQLAIQIQFPGTVYTVGIKTETGFREAWSNMSNNVNIVVLLFHANSNLMSFDENYGWNETLKNSEISELAIKNVHYMALLGCNMASAPSNAANQYIENHGVDAVIASRGYVNHSVDIWGNYNVKASYYHTVNNERVYEKRLETTNGGKSAAFIKYTGSGGKEIKEKYSITGLLKKLSSWW